MKKYLILIFFIASLLCSCGKTEESAQFEFPYTTWRMSEEEVRNACKITEENISYSEKTDRSSVLITENYEVFGEKSAQTIFHFLDVGNDGNMVLSYIQVVYPEEADMGKVLDNMKKMYGETSPEVTYYLHFSSLGLAPHEGIESEELKIWANAAIADTITETDAETYRELLMPLQYGLNEENWEEYSRNARLVTVRCSAEEEKKEIIFDAVNYAVYCEMQEMKEESMN